MTTLKHFELAVPVLRGIRERFDGRVYFKLIGDPRYRNDELGIRGVEWRPRARSKTFLSSTSA